MIFLLGNFSRTEMSGETLTGSNYLHYILSLYYYFIFIYYFNDFFCRHCATNSFTMFLMWQMTGFAETVSLLLWFNELQTAHLLLSAPVRYWRKSLVTVYVNITCVYVSQ